MQRGTNTQTHTHNPTIPISRPTNTHNKPLYDKLTKFEILIIKTTSLTIKNLANISKRTNTYIYIYKDGCCRSKKRIRLYFRIRRSTKRFVFFKFIYFVLTYVLYTCMFPVCCFLQRTYVAQGLVNGVLNEIWTHSCFQFEWPLVGKVGLYRSYSPSFREWVYFGLLYLSLIFDMFIVVCMCVCVCVYWGWSGFGFL